MKSSLFRGTGRGEGAPPTECADRGEGAAPIETSLLHKLAIGLIGLLVLAPSLLYGQVAPKRLSDWLLEQPISPDAYPLGLSWRVPGEVAAQSELRLDLLRSLSGLDVPRSFSGLDLLRSFSGLDR